MATKAGIIYPTNDAFFGGLEKTTDALEIAKSKLYHLFLTMTGEIRMLPQFGNNLYKVLFDNDGMLDENLIKEEIISAANVWVGSVVIKSVETKFVADDNMLTIQVHFQLKNDSTQEDVLIINLAI